MKLSDNTSISLPARNLLAILAAVAIGTMSYFTIIERLNSIVSRGEIDRPRGEKEWESLKPLLYLVCMSMMEATKQ